MAYKTGFVSSANSLLAEITSFAVGQAGWILEHDVSSNEKVLKSLGSDSESLIFIKLRTGVKDYNANSYSSAWQNQEFNNAHHEHINISLLQSYDPSESTAYNEQDGKAGPWILCVDGWNSSTEGEDRTLYGLPESKEENNFSSWVSTRVHPNNFGSTNSQAPSHRRRWQGSRHSRDLIALDLIKSNQTITHNNIEHNCYSLFAYDENGNPATYYLNTENSTNPIFFKIVQNTANITASGINSARITLAIPPAGTTSYRGSDMCWDGKDYIYITKGAGSAAFYRYQISTNTWTTLSDMPGGVGSRDPLGANCYIPKESDIAIEKGWTSDKIIQLRSGNTTGERQTYIYDVDSDTWGSLSLYPLNSNNTSGVNPSLCWNGRDKLYAVPGTNDSRDFFKYSIRNDSWENVGGLAFTAGSGTQMIHLQPYQAQITVDTNGSKYWLWGDEDRIIIVTEDIATGETRFQYMGNIESYYSTQKVTLSSGVTAGTNVVLPVTGSFDEYVVGHKYYIVDVDGTSGAAESFLLVDTDEGTLVAGSLQFDYGPGAIIGIDPQPTVSICNEYDAVFCLHSDKGQGGLRNAVNNPHEQSYMMPVLPAQPELLFSSAPGRRGHVQIWPFIVATFTPREEGASPNFIASIMSAAGSSKGMTPSQFEGTEVRGQLKGVFSLAKNNATGEPGPQPGDEVQVGGSTYLVFRCDNFMDHGDGGGKSLLAIGPVV